MQRKKKGECKCKGPEVGKSLVCLSQQEGKSGRGIGE